jgi:hypothetical protein
MSALHVHVEQHKHYPAYIVYVTQTKKWQNCKAKILRMAMPGEQIVKLRACRYSPFFSGSLRWQNWPALPIRFGAKFSLILTQKSGKFRKCVFF